MKDLVIVQNQQEEHAMSVQLVCGDCFVSPTVRRTVPERVREVMESVIRVFMEHGDALAIKRVWTNSVNIAVS